MGLLILAGIVFVITAIAVLIDTYGELILSVDSLLQLLY